MRVLIVEDEPEFANTLRIALERERFIVDQADRISMAQEAAMSGSYDLVLLDRTLPDGDGLSLLPILRETHPGLPVIVLSARGEVIDIPADRFTGRVLRRGLASTSIYRVQAEPVLSVRDCNMIRRKPLDDFFLSVLTEGVITVSQNGRQATQQAGDLLLYSGNKPLKHEIRERCSGVWVRLPRRLLDSRLSNAESFTARTISSSTPIGAMTSSFLLNAARVDLEGKASVASHVLNSMFELIAAALASSHCSALGSSRHVNLLDRVKEYIAARLSDPDFRCDDVIQVIGISRSTLNRLFAFEGTTPGRWLWHKRLERSRAMLEARGSGRIIDVSLNCGFKDTAHFIRAFKAEFGISPRAVTER